MRVDYKKDLGYRHRLILLEDNPKFNYLAWCSLTKAGFDVMALEDASRLRPTLELLLDKQLPLDVIFSDSDMGKYTGYEVIKQLIDESRDKPVDKKLIGENVLICATSDEHHNEKYWVGIANTEAFYDKNLYALDGNEGRDIGSDIMAHYWRFMKSGKAWRRKLMKMD